jgi:hypothetical protein
MNREITFLDCPGYVDKRRAVRCGLPALVTARFIMESSDGPLESAMIVCPAGHRFSAPIEFLEIKRRSDTARPAGAASGLESSGL